jgi:LPXTG-site transpeptidase (sortase) family protein
VIGNAANVLSETKEFVERLEAIPAGDALDHENAHRLDEARGLLRAIVAEGGTLMLDAADLLRRSLVVDLAIVHRARSAEGRRSAAIRPLLQLPQAAPPVDPPSVAWEPADHAVRSTDGGGPANRPLTDPAGERPRVAADVAAGRLLEALRNPGLEADQALEIAELARRRLGSRLRQITAPTASEPGIGARSGKPVPVAVALAQEPVPSSSPRLRTLVTVDLVPAPAVLPAPPPTEAFSRAAPGRPGDTVATVPAVLVDAGAVDADLRVFEPHSPAVQAPPAPPAPAPLADLPPPSGAPVLPLEAQKDEAQIDEADEEVPLTNGEIVRTGALAAARAIGIVLVCFVAYALFVTGYTQGFAQRRMNPRSHLRISSPNIGLDQLVLGSDSRSALAKGPGLAAGSGTPGSTVPVVIAGHRTTNGAPFRHLTALAPGSSIVLRSTNGVIYDYVVQRAATLPPHAELSLPAGGQALMLVTAAPAYHDSKRFVVVARLLGAGPSTGSRRVALPALGGSGANLAAGALVLLFLGALWAARSLWRQWLPRWARWASWLPAVALAYLSWQLLLGSMSRVL